ncbi:MAG: hypothetical protein HY854_05855 [Burkholderiales bacterium]|nr:hypothetical protein [Burkholderiales bacterium]
MSIRNAGRPWWRNKARLSSALGAAALLFSVPAALANGLGENGSWQFQTTQDRVNKGAILDLIERKRGGFYDSFTTNNYNTTYNYVDKQFNCSVSSTSTGNAGTNGMDASTSSPTVTNSANTSASTNANAATNGVTQNGVPGVVLASLNPSYPYNGSLGNNQANSGALNSAVNGSSTNSNTGPVSAGGSSTDQVLNSTQNNSGSQSASVSGSTACNGPFVSN